MSAFLYLGRTIAFNNRDWEDLYQNLTKVQRLWRVVSGVMVKVGETVQSSVVFYKLVVQAFLLYGSKIYWSSNTPWWRCLDKGKHIYQYRSTVIEIFLCLNKSTLHWVATDKADTRQFPSQVVKTCTSFVGVSSMGVTQLVSDNNNRRILAFSECKSNPLPNYNVLLLRQRKTTMPVPQCWDRGFPLYWQTVLEGFHNWKSFRIVGKM